MAVGEENGSRLREICVREGGETELRIAVLLPFDIKMRKPIGLHDLVQAVSILDGLPDEACGPSAAGVDVLTRRRSDYLTTSVLNVSCRFGERPHLSFQIAP